MTQPKWIYGTAASILLFSAGVLAWTLVGGKEKVLLRGNFHSVAHKGAGEARIVALNDGRKMLRLLDLQTYPSPGLEVCLLNAPDAEDNEGVRQAAPVCLGAYDGRLPFHAYRMPAGVDLNRYRAVAIWSSTYQVNFTTAPLAP